MYTNSEEMKEDVPTFTGNYRGIVVNNQDPLQAGRCQVRIFSVYDDIPDEMLPWAQYADSFMQGSRGSGGFFIPDNGMKVWCFFEAGDHMQPVFFAGAPSLIDGPSNKAANERDVPRYGVQYTQNRVIRSPSGHLLEMDDTAGDSRLRLTHKTGSQIIMYENGDVHEIVVGNYRRTIGGNFEEYITGDSLRMVTGNETNVTSGNYSEYFEGTRFSATIGDATSIYKANFTMTVNGNETSTVVGNFTKNSGGTSTIESTGNGFIWSKATMDIDAALLNMNLTTAPPVPAAPPAPDDAFIQTTEFQITPVNASVLIDVAGSKAAFDDEDETVPGDWPAEEVQAPVAQPTEINVEATPAAPVSPGCDLITKVDYNYQLSASFRLADVSRNALYPHPIRAQHGLSESDIICNLKQLCANILEPLKAKFPNIRINSAFRVGSGTSQHERGQAVDIQVPGGSAKQYSDMAAWIVRNLPFDQFILEHGRSVWLHLSYNPTLPTQRGVKLTYWPQGSPQYKPGLKNYYDSGRVIT